MPMSTGPNTPPLPPMAGTRNIVPGSPGVGGLTSMGPAPAPGDLKPQEPMLPDGIDPVLLMRLYPDSLDVGGAAELALKQGRETRELGEQLVANQQISQQDEVNERAAAEGRAVPAPGQPPHPAPQAPPQAAQQAYYPPQQAAAVQQPTNAAYYPPQQPPQRTS